jgi:hypothetical protein
MVSEETIRYWVEQVNKEIGREDRIEDSVRYFMALRKIAVFDIQDEYYLVYLIAPDMWGDKEMHVVSMYIKPEFRTGKYFLEIQRKIKGVCKKNKVRYTIQGSHIDNRYFKFLKGIGYEVCSMKKENKNG